MTMVILKIKRIEANGDNLEASVQEQAQVCRSLQQIAMIALKIFIAYMSILY